MNICTGVSLNSKTKILPDLNETEVVKLKNLTSTHSAFLFLNQHIFNFRLDNLYHRANNSQAWCRVTHCTTRQPNCPILHQCLYITFYLPPSSSFLPNFHQLILSTVLFCFSVYHREWDHIVFVLLSLTYFVYRIPSRSIPVARNCKIKFFLQPYSIQLYIYAIAYLSIHILSNISVVPIT